MPSKCVPVTYVAKLNLFSRLSKTLFFQVYRKGIVKYFELASEI